MRTLPLATLISLLFFLISPISAIFADEAYQIDYQHSLLGTPLRRNTFFHQPSQTSKASLLYTLSEKGLLGAVNPRDGELVWRQWLKGDTRRDSGHVEDDGAPEHGLLEAGDGMVVSAVGRAVKAWDAADGGLLWGWDGNGHVRSMAVLNSAGDSKNLVVLSVKGNRAVVTRLSATDGRTLWQVSEEGSDVPLAVASSAKELYYLSLQPAMLGGQKIKVTTLDSVTGKELAHTTLSSESEITSKGYTTYVGAKTSTPIVAWTDAGCTTLKINVLGSKHVTTINIASKHHDDVRSIRVQAPETAIAMPHFLVHYQADSSHWAEVFHIDIASGTIKKAYDLPKAGGVGAFSVSTVDANVYFTRHTSEETVLMLSASHGILERWPLTRKTHGATTTDQEIFHAVSEIVPRGPSNFAVRSAVTRASGDWELVRNGESLWLRHESLAGVLAAAWADIPNGEDLARELAVESHDNVLSAYIRRVRRHVKDLKHLPAWLQHIPARILRSFAGVGPGGADRSLQRDAFGFRKVALVATEKGRVAALDSGLQGQVLWNVQVVRLPPGTKWNVTAIEVDGDTATILAENVFLQQAQGPESTALLAGFDGPQSTAHQKVLTMQSWQRHIAVWRVLLDKMSSGHPPVFMESTPLNSESANHFERFISVPQRNGKKALMPIYHDGTPGVAPSSLYEGTTVTSQRTDGTIAGWSLAGGAKPTLSWSFSPAPGETISSIAHRPAHDPVASIGRALGDRNVLYKYLSPNLLLVTALGLATSTASVYLLDTITGQTLYTTTHTGVDTSHHIPATISENWFAYSLFSDPSVMDHNSTTSPFPPKAHQLIVSELFESPFPNDRGALGDRATVSALSSPPLTPHVISTSFVIPAPLSLLTTTSTLQGITPRSLVAYCPPLSAILSIPVPILSPRRPVGREPTPAEREEGLPPYAPFLDLAPQWTLSHKREVLGVRGVSVSPSLMESTSLLLAWGDVDLFGTRVSPIGAFDVLGKGFGKLQLVLTIVGLAVGTGVLRPMARRRGVDALWRG